MRNCVMGLPGFRWKALQDFIRTRFRVATLGSAIPEIRGLGYVMLEKRVYMSHDYTAERQFIPLQHFDRWTLYDAREYDGTQPYFSADPIQTNYRNAIWYLLHAHLIGLPSRFVMLLEEKQHNDRNKAVALAMNANVKRYASIDLDFDENTVGDAFTKSIRHNVSRALDYWDPSYSRGKMGSDLDAIRGARTLSLLPMPTMVKELIYSEATLKSNSECD